MSLRDRKKLATRTALMETSRKLFAEKGYENTTLEEICDAVQIHVTTFFSYFASKEDLAFARLHEVFAEFREELAARPPEVDVMTCWWRYVAQFSLRARGEESAIMMRMDEVPALRNGYANINRMFEQEIGRALAIEAGADPETDLHSQLLAATMMGAVVAGSLWHRRTYGPKGDAPDTHAFARLVLASFPSRQQVAMEAERVMAEAAAKAAERASRRGEGRRRA